MAKSTGEITKARKPRAPETGTPVLVRLQPDQLAKVDAAAKAEGTSRPEAIRRLIDRPKWTNSDASNRENLNFKQAEGLEPLPTQLKREEVSRELRAYCWYILFETITKQFEEFGPDSVAEPWRSILRDYLLFDKFEMVDDIPEAYGLLMRKVKSFLDAGNYGDFYNFLQFILRHEQVPNSFARLIDGALVRARSAYRVLNNRTIAPIASEEERASINLAFKDLSSVDFRAAQAHLTKAVEAVSAGEWASSIRESVHAVESVARSLAPGSKGLGKALSVLDEAGHIHTALERGFSAIYGFTSDEKGIRHPLIDSPEAQVDEADALFMLGACASFVSYLINKGRVAGLLTTP